MLAKARKAYENGTPIMTDAAYDYLYRKYGDSEIGHSDNTMTQHTTRLYSLANCFKGEINPLGQYLDTVETPKLDGAAVSLEYINGELVVARTRGNGFKGKDITDKMVSLVPTKLKSKHSVQIIGEIVAPKSIKNARNYASGALNLKDYEEFLNRELYFIAYNMISTSCLDTYREDMTKHVDLIGFNTVLDPEIDFSIFPTDGIVERVNSNALYNDLGFTAHHPRGAIAHKVQAESVETKLLEVEWKVGAGGKINPVAIFEPIEIGDAIINRAALHNPGFIEKWNIDIGDTLLIIRSGGIIPKIEGVVKA